MHDWFFLLPVWAIWFILYWIIGGVIFSLLALFRVTKLRKAQFSCLFTLSCIGFAYGATHTAYILGEAAMHSCLVQAQDIFEQFASVIACGMLPIIFTGSIWFISLILFGALLLFLSRAKNQSWVDEEIKEQQPELVNQVKNFHIH